MLLSQVCLSSAAPIRPPLQSKGVQMHVQESAIRPGIVQPAAGKLTGQQQSQLPH